MNIKVRNIGKSEFIDIDNDKLFITFCNIGASLYSLIFNGKNMLMTPKNYNVFLLDEIYHGKTISRTANRIKGNIIEIDDQKYTLDANENGNTLHGGKAGLSSKFFKYKITELSSSVKLMFYYISKEGESGYPGALKVKVTYLIPKEGSKIKVLYDAKTNKATLCNLTNHAFFTLGESNISTLSLKINASKYLLTNKNDLLPVCIEPITKELNFLRFKRLTKDINSKVLKEGKTNGYDHHFYFDEIVKKPQILLKSREVLLKIKTDFSGVQIYSDNYPDNFEWSNVCGGTNRAIAIEPQDDILNRKILRPNEKYRRYIEYNFVKK